MKKELQDKLLNKYPKLYQNYYKGMKETCMCLGFECGDGWYDLIDDLSNKLSTLDIVAEQVKEKFGALRFYYTGSSDDCKKADEYVLEAEALSLRTCERCGELGIRRGGGWIKVLCNKCAKDDGRTSVIPDDIFSKALF